MNSPETNASAFGYTGRSDSTISANQRLVQDAAYQVKKAIGEYLGAARTLADQDRKIVNRTVDDVATECDRKISQAEDTYRDGRRSILTRARQISQRLLREPSGSGNDICQLSEYVCIGELALDSSDYGLTNIRSDCQVPAIVPLLGHGNLIIRRNQTAHSDLSLTDLVVVRALENSAPGQLSTQYYSPDLHRTNTPFAHLYSANQVLFPRMLSSTEDFKILIRDLQTMIGRVASMLKGRYQTLTEMQSAVRRFAEPHRLIVLYDLPSTLEDEVTWDALSTTWSMGPSCGVSFVLEVSSSFSALSPFVRHLHSSRTTFVDPIDGMVDTAPDYVFLPDAPPNKPELSNRIEPIAQILSRTAPPSPSFESLHASVPMWSRSSSEGLRAIFGTSGADTLQFKLGDEARQTHNALIAGSVGSGKSNLLMAIIHSIAWQYSPDEVEMYLIDMKDGLTLKTLGPTSNAPNHLPHARFIGLVSDHTFTIEILEDIIDLFESRAEKFAGIASDIRQYRVCRPDDPVPRVLVIIDEFQKLFTADDLYTQRAVDALVRLAREGRAYGIHLILSTQTIQGIPSLIFQSSVILAQFAVRLALKNSVEQSRVILAEDNPDASSLSFRGEVLVNLEHGARNANVRGIVMDARASETTQIRSTILDRVQHPKLVDPRSLKVLDDSQPASFVAHLPALRELRRTARSKKDEILATVGAALSIHDIPLGPTLTASPGSHVAIYGSSRSRQTERERLSGSVENATQPDLALGMLFMLSVALSAQSPTRLGEAPTTKFIILDMLTTQERSSLPLEDIVASIHRLGPDVEIVPHAEIARRISQLGESVLQAASGLQSTDLQTPVYIIAPALDRCALDVPDDSLDRPTDALQTLLRVGPTSRVHMCIWWNSTAGARSMLGIGGLSQISNSILLGVDSADVSDLVGVGYSWKFRQNRALLAQSGVSRPTTIVPFGMPSVDELRRIEAYLLDTDHQSESVDSKYRSLD